MAWVVLMKPDGTIDKENIGIVAPADAATGKPETGANGFNYNV